MLRTIFALAVLVVAADAVASAQAIPGPFTVTTAPIELKFASPAPDANVVQTSPLTITATASLSLVYNAPAANTAPDLKSIRITASGLEITFPPPKAK